MQTKLPNEITQTLFIFASKQTWENEYTISFSSTNYSELSEDLLLLGKQEITIKVPKVGFIKNQVDFLHEKKRKLLARVELEKNKIDEEIQSLLAIACK